MLSSAAGWAVKRVRALARCLLTPVAAAFQQQIAYAHDTSKRSGELGAHSIEGVPEPATFEGQLAIRRGGGNPWLAQASKQLPNRFRTAH